MKKAAPRYDSIIYDNLKAQQKDTLGFDDLGAFGTRISPRLDMEDLFRK